MEESTQQKITITMLVNTLWVIAFAAACIVVSAVYLRITPLMFLGAMALAPALRLIYEIRLNGMVYAPTAINKAQDGCPKKD